MRKTALGLLLLTALLVCTLIAGTPVNNDPSPAARTAGIHLTTPAAHSRSAATVLTAVLPALGALVALALLVRRSPLALRRSDRSTPMPTALLRWGAGGRRGPPAFA